MTPPNCDLLYLTPIAPASTGNGMAMRNWVFLNAALGDFSVQTVIVPVVGHGQVPAELPAVVLRLHDLAEVTAAVPALLANPVWRDRIGRAYPLPPLATLAPPTLADAVLRAAGPARGTPVHVARSYLAPLGVALAERLSSPWATLDLDDDDQALAESAGRDAEAQAYWRLVGTFGPLFSGMAVAAPGEAAGITARHGLAARVIPNSVPAGRQLPARHSRAGAASLLFVGNLTYWPNQDAATRLVSEVLPRLRELGHPGATLTLVGDTGGDAGLRALGLEPGVRVTGFAPDLEPYYRAADVLVASLAFGAGSRIKLLEAFARGVPVVTSSQGAAGLEVTDGVHALIADTAAGQAAAVARLLADDRLRRKLVAGASELARGRYSHAAVLPLIREFFAAAAASGRAGTAAEAARS
jgi:polysaccharide biosynthesis protein PslH